ncbi:reverse transcriptase [Anopheles sinensis]|uniref:Reverse transcriptase n=1 Tax=Anopheles sinensis TaxID=74873 RepID=A0A084VXW4_ANOSI|nr:reverse transcriptase [Anopheles sinensis]
MFKCPQFAEVRGRLLTGQGLQTATADNLFEHLLHSQEAWDRVNEAEPCGKAASGGSGREPRAMEERTFRRGPDPMDKDTRRDFRRRAAQLLGRIRRLRDRRHRVAPEVYVAKMARNLSRLPNHDAAPDRWDATAAALEDG